MISLVPVYAEDLTGTKLLFSSPEPVQAITAYFDVLDDNVENIEVTFDAGINGQKFANYIKEDKQLRVVIASLETIDLSKPIGAAVATLENTSKINPNLKLTYYKTDLGKAISNVIPKSVTGELIDGNLTVKLTLYDDLVGSTEVLLSVYDNAGRFLGIKQETAKFTSEKQAFSFDMGKYSNACTIKAIFVNSNWQAYCAAVEGSIR